MRKKFNPREYQVLIVRHMVFTRRNAVFAGMGLGKTVAALTAIDIEFLAGVETKPALVLAPLRVAQSTWPTEAKKWDHLTDIRVQPIIGTLQQRRAALANREANVFTINYENLPWLIEECADYWPFGRVVGDESTRLKSFRLKQGGKRAQAMAKVAHTKIKRWTNLTGTPAPNGLVDLWGQTWFLDAGERLGRSYSAFIKRWFTTSFDGWGVEPRESAPEQIAQKLSGLCLSLDAADFFDLEKPIEIPVHVELPPEARRMYTEMERRLVMELGDGTSIEAVNAAVKSQKCLQLASGAIYLDNDAYDDKHMRTDKEWAVVHDEKISALESIVSEAAGAPLLVAYHFKSDLARLKKAFPKSRVLDKNPETIDLWNAGKIPMLLAHPASAGHGLNLQDGGNIVVIFSHFWSLENFQQILERIGPVRQFQAGHKRPVFIYYIIARDTTDEDVMLSRQTKESVQALLRRRLKERVLHAD